MFDLEVMQPMKTISHESVLRLKDTEYIEHSMYGITAFIATAYLLCPSNESLTDNVKRK